MLVIGPLLIGVVFLFPTKPVETRVRSTTPEQTQVLGKLAYSLQYEIAIGQYFINVYTANADGSGQTRIGPERASQPAWSPDGSKIAYCSGCYFLGFSTDIWVMDANGAYPTNLTNTPGINENSPSWSVTGKIAYVRDNQIWAMNVDGSNQVLFHGITQPSPYSPVWSPDGSKLAFGSGNHIWLINADGTNEHRLSTNPSPDSGPAWSPNGSKIAFTRGGPFPGIYVINVDGTNEVSLSVPGANITDYSPSWSSDNTKIAFLRSAPTGAISGIYVMNTDGTNPIRLSIPSGGIRGGVAFQPVSTANRQRFDFDGDFKDDFAVYRAGSTPTAQSYWDILRSGTNTPLSVQFGSGEDRIVPADYNGDGKTDIAVFRPSNGSWYITTDFGINYTAIHWGTDGDIPLPGDFDGDGKADIAVYRPSEGVWYILRSSDGSFVGHQFGTSTDKPLLMDYDGDRKTDLAFLRTAGTDYYWFILQSSNNTAVVPRFSIVGDKAVPADYDGDGKSNLAVYRPETGKWIILNAAGTGSVEYQWGVSGDLPAPGNFDADGLTDLTVFRPDTATWYVARSAGSPLFQEWGRGTDMPVQAAYIP
jgi:Tol biopolymer transport system component